MRTSYCVPLCAVCIIFLLITYTDLQGTDFSFNPDAGSHYQVNVTSSSPVHAGIQFEMEQLIREEIRTNEETLTRFPFPEAVSIGEPGMPDFPVIIRMVLIPARCGVELKVNEIETRIENNIHPSPYVSPEHETSPSLTRVSQPGSNQVCTGEDGFWPPQVASIGTPAVMRGYRILPVVIHPLRWNPQTSEIQVVESIDLELDYTSELNRVNLVDNPERPRPSETVYKMVSQLVLNPPPPPRDLGIRNGSIIYIIGNWNDVEETLEPLIEWRRSMGWTAEIIRVNQNNSNGAIKSAIQEAYDEWEIPPEFIVLVGDAPHLQGNNYTLAYYDERNGAGHPYETDHHYTELEGRDILPEAAIGRLPFNNVNMLRDMVNKTVMYESEPYIGNGDDRGWQKRAALMAGDSRSGTSSIDACRWTKNLVTRHGFTDVAERYWTPNEPQPNGRQFIMGNIDNGISLLLYRGWTFMSGFAFEDVDRLRNGRMLPFVMLATCNTGDYGEHVSSQWYYSERFVYSRDGGAIGAVGAAGATHTAYNNLIATSTIKAFFADGIYNQGWALMQGKVDLYRHYAEYGDIDHRENPGLEGWECELYIFNLMGDPAVDLYTDMPIGLNVECPDLIRAGETRFEVTVQYENDEEPAENTRICLYKPDEFQIVSHTNADGFVSFDLDPEMTQDGDIKLTVTGHNLMPYIHEYEIENVDFFLGSGEVSVDDDEEGDSAGDDDQVANQTERIELTVDIVNYGDRRPDGEITATLSPGHPLLEVVEGEVEFEQAPDPGRAVEAGFVVDIGGGFPTGMDAVFILEVTAEDETWISNVSIPVEGPDFEFVSLRWEGEPLTPSGVADCNIRLKNIGSKNSQALVATLISLSPTINVPVGEGEYSWFGIDSERSSRGLFRLSANLFHIGGAPAELALILQSENGFIDTVFFNFIVDEPRDGQPFGPDSYGYICVDDTDIDWFSAPEFDWIEIDPHYRGRGDNTNLTDTGEEHDASMVMDLPFDFTYYGEEFDEITICTNGWLAMGDCHELITARNRKIPAGMVAPGMICPFWDDLITTDAGGIYTDYFPNDHIFVIEWSRMRKLGPRGVDEPTETFQVILYDPEFYPSFTGDGDIVFQYLDVIDDRSCFQLWDTPFATVGIGSPDQSDGLEYSYGNDLHPGAALIEDDRAIKFTTAVLTSTGTIFGSVIDASSGDPVPDATVYTKHGFLGVTDQVGYYVMENAPAELEFDITATKLGFNDSTVTDLLLEEGEELEVNFNLLHPEFNLSIPDIDARLQVDSQSETALELANNGNGPLHWSSERRNPGEANADPWELRESLYVGEILDDGRIGGVVFDDGYFYVSGAGEDQTLIYVLDMQGDLVRTFDQFGIARYGMVDLAWDGQLIWGSGERNVYGITTDGELAFQWEGPYNPNTNVAWDRNQQLLWVSGITTSRIVGYNREGEEQTTLERCGFRIYGLAYWPDDPDGYNLYLFHSPAGGIQMIHKMNTADNDTMYVCTLEHEDGGRPGAAFISSQYDYYSWVFMAISNDGRDDRIDIWQLDSRRDWIGLNPVSGVLDAGETDELTITLDLSGFPPVELEGEIAFYHNADGGMLVFPIRVEIVEGDLERELVISLEEGWNMISINVYPPQEFYREGEAGGPGIRLMLEQLRVDEDHHHVEIAKNGEGRFYLPAWQEYCDIPYWSLDEGIMIKVDEDVEATWTGEPIPADTDVALHRGWNMIAYFPQYQLPCESPDFYVLSPIIEHVALAKDIDGRFMSTAFNYSDMEPWRETCGYLVNVDEDLTLNYPPEPDENRLARADHTVKKLPDHWTSPPRTDASMSVLINQVSGFHPEVGDLVAAFDDDGRIVGLGSFNSSSRCGLAVWGDDPTTDAIDGLRDGESFTFMLWDEDTGSEIELGAAAVLAGDGLEYRADAFVVLEASANAMLPETTCLSPCYPNPFNAATRINFGLIEDGDVQLAIFDLSGRLVERLYDGHSSAGNHSVAWDATDRPSGVYLVRLTCDSQRFTRKVTLMR